MRHILICVQLIIVDLRKDVMFAVSKMSNTLSKDNINFYLPFTHLLMTVVNCYHSSYKLCFLSSFLSNTITLVIKMQLLDQLSQWIHTIRWGVFLPWQLMRNCFLSTVRLKLFLSLITLLYVVYIMFVIHKQTCTRISLQPNTTTCIQQAMVSIYNSKIT